MNLTKTQIKEMYLKEYYILIDGVNDDKIARCKTLKEIKQEARKYDKECDGEWEPVLVLYSRNEKRGKYIEDWTY